MRQLWRNVDASVAARRHRPLPLQRVRPLLQNERTKSTAYQAQTTFGEYSVHCIFFFVVAKVQL